MVHRVLSNPPPDSQLTPSCVSFVLVCHCPPLSCRHATISKFFGDKAPTCTGACDYCRNPKAVRAQLERASALSTKIQAQSDEPSGAFGFQADLYEGGKKGYGFERQDGSRRLNSSFNVRPDRLNCRSQV